MTDDFDRDEPLRARLRSGDPAASLPPLDHASTARLTQVAMSTPSTATTRSGPASRLPRLIAAAAVVVAGGGGLWSVIGSDDDAAPTAATDPAPASSAPSTPAAPGSPGSPAPAPAATVLTAPAAVAAKCMVPNVEVLRRQDLAFQGTVTALDGLTVDLSTAKVYAGDVADAVRVRAPSAEMSMLLNAVQFEVGKSYLVSATDGQVTLCGFSAEATPELTALYAEAYGG